MIASLIAGILSLITGIGCLLSFLLFMLAVGTIVFFFDLLFWIF